MITRYAAGASLRGCNFEDPAGSRANMEGVNLKGAVLEESNMAGVNLRVANLKKANLQNCILRGAVLAGADLEVPVVPRTSISKSWHFFGKDFPPSFVFFPNPFSFWFCRAATCRARTCRRPTCGGLT